jgi:uncharacterized protein (TIGR02145 family)
VDLGDNGEWDNGRERAQIADWAMKKTVSKEGLASIRKNIKAWNLRDGEPPAFEDHILNFWQKELGVDECSESNKNAIKAATNKYSAYYAQKDSVFTEDDSNNVRLICAADGESFAWRIATDIEKNTAALTEPSEGDFRRGSIDTSNVYVYENGKWRDGTDLDVLLNSSCVAANLGAMKSLTVRNVATWYVCDSALVAWREATTAEADTVGFGMPDGDTARVGNVHKSNYYVYEMVDGVGKWRYGTERDVHEDLGPCTQNRLNTIVHLSDATEDVGWYKCASDWAAVSNGEKIPHAWREATIQEADTAWINARAADLIGNYEKVILKGNFTRDSMNYYVHVNGSQWRRADTLEMDSYDTLTHMAWVGENDGDFAKGAVTKRYYVYEKANPNNIWRLENSPLDHDPDLRGCTYSRSNHINNGVKGELVHKKVGDETFHYVCLNSLWREADSARWDTEGFKCSSDSRKVFEGSRNNGVFYTCEADTFRVLTESEKWAKNVHARKPQYASETDELRCGPADNGSSIELPPLKTRFVCREGFYEWDGHPTYWGFEWGLPHDKQNHRYDMVAIGTQLWLAKNLYQEFEDPDVAITPENVGADSVNYYGRLYRYEAGVQACKDLEYTGLTYSLPTTFHLPTEDEWKVLFSNESDEYIVAQAFKSKNSWEYNEGNDKYLFSAIPAGDAVKEPEYNLSKRRKNRDASFWTGDSAWIAMTFNDQKILYYDYQKQTNVEQEYLSVRCIGDSDIPVPPKNPNKY